ncbi:hypothetical protein CEXT_330991 [Caerostris extrusa]|uniref:Uncharacterized protein n=1 Tax=Caerostris extrusa TaxID=172846 RepID=A0AAV4V8L1_CAEEX|nr:hypothetical protein CEXT_330991 [Caerostris extrusa]
MAMKRMARQRDQKIAQFSPDKGFMALEGAEKKKERTKKLFGYELKIIIVSYVRLWGWPWNERRDSETKIAQFSPDKRFYGARGQNGVFSSVNSFRLKNRKKEHKIFGYELKIIIVSCTPLGMAMERMARQRDQNRQFSPDKRFYTLGGRT